jgi:hypothetical protein
VTRWAVKERLPACRHVTVTRLQSPFPPLAEAWPCSRLRTVCCVQAASDADLQHHHIQILGQEYAEAFDCSVVRATRWLKIGGSVSGSRERRVGWHRADASRRDGGPETSGEQHLNSRES